jgi:hypothetical protein
MLRPGIRWSNKEFRDAFKEAGLLKEFIDILDNINSTPIVMEKYRPPSVIVRTLAYDSFSMLMILLSPNLPNLSREGVINRASTLPLPP